MSVAPLEPDDLAHAPGQRVRFAGLGEDGRLGTVVARRVTLGGFWGYTVRWDGAKGSIGLYWHADLEPVEAPAPVSEYPHEWEDHQEGEACYTREGGTWHATVRGMLHGTMWERSCAFTLKADARAWAVSLIGRRVK